MSRAYNHRLSEKMEKKSLSKHFTVKNEGFLCKKCHEKIPPQKTSCRNHCSQCLYSLHVDESYPGDRLSNCHGLMEPTEIAYSGKKGFIIVHRCLTCKKIIRNKTAPDDNLETLLKFMRAVKTPPTKTHPIKIRQGKK